LQILAGLRTGDISATKNFIKISIYGFLFNTADVVVSKQYGIDAAIQLDNTRIWVAQKKLTAKAALNTCVSVMQKK
jgi:hypothetical protein